MSLRGMGVQTLPLSASVIVQKSPWDSVSVFSSGKWKKVNPIHSLRSLNMSSQEKVLSASSDSALKAFSQEPTAALKTSESKKLPEGFLQQAAHSSLCWDYCRGDERGKHAPGNLPFAPQLDQTLMKQEFFFRSSVTQCFTLKGNEKIMCTRALGKLQRSLVHDIVIIAEARARHAGTMLCWLWTVSLSSLER